jgi:hypothetical protein
MADAVRPSDQESHVSREEIRPLIQEEVGRLPEKYRTPVVLSYFEGKSNEEVADLLKWPVGTVKGRLSRAREMLRSRLKRRGLALSTAFLLFALESESSAATEVDGLLFEETQRTSRAYRSIPSPEATAASASTARRRLAQRMLIYLAVLAAAASAFGYEYRDSLRNLRAVDLYEGAVDLIPVSTSAPASCH